MNTKKCWKLETALALTAVALLVGFFFGFGGFRFNATPSLPMGLYRIAGGQPQRGDLVSFCLALENPYMSLARERGYLHPGSCPSGLQPLLKRLVGMPGDHLEVTHLDLRLNGLLLPGTTRPEADSQGRPLPPTLLMDGLIPEGSALVLSQDHAGSFDSRHFGYVPLNSLQQVKPVWVSAR